MGLDEEDVQRLVAELAHPVRLVLMVGDLVDRGVGQARVRY